MFFMVTMMDRQTDDRLIDDRLIDDRQTDDRLTEADKSTPCTCMFAQ